MPRLVQCSTDAFPGVQTAESKTKTTTSGSAFVVRFRLSGVVQLVSGTSHTRGEQERNIHTKSALHPMREYVSSSNDEEEKDA